MTTFNIRTAPSNFSSNNNENIEIDERNIAINRYSDLGILVLNPFIDTLELGYSLQGIEFQNIEEQLEFASQLTKNVYTNITNNKPNPSTGILYDNNYVQDNQLLTLSKKQGYALAWCLEHPESGERIQMQALSKEAYKNSLTSKKPRPFIRITLNPHRLGKDGMDFFATHFNIMLNDDAAYTRLILTPGIVKRVHTAVDILGVGIEDITITPQGKKSDKMKTHVYIGKKNRKETLYLQTSGKSSDNYIYDRKAAARDKGFAPVYGEALNIRYERRSSFSAKKRIVDLLNLSNRIAQIMVCAVNYGLMKDKGFAEVLFMKYAILRSEAKALEAIPTNLQGEYSDLYKDALVPLITDTNRKALWGRYKNWFIQSGIAKNLIECTKTLTACDKE